MFKGPKDLTGFRLGGTAKEKNGLPDDLFRVGIAEHGAKNRVGFQNDQPFRISEDDPVWRLLKEFPAVKDIQLATQS